MPMPAISTRGASAVMASRREPPDSLDYFPSPPWSVRALFEHVLPVALAGRHICSAWEPACGEGHIVGVLQERVAVVKASDVFDYGRGFPVADFLDPATCMSPRVDFIVTNPPFNTALQFAESAFHRASVGVALLVRTQWIEGADRYERLFRRHPPTVFAPFVERVPMVKGRWDPSASTATAYAWFVWIHGAEPMPPLWIPPGCRERLSRPDDIRRFAQLAPAPLFDEAA